MPAFLEAEQVGGDPGEDHGDVALDDLVIALGGELVPGDLFFSARSGVGTE